MWRVNLRSGGPGCIGRGGLIDLGCRLIDLLRGLKDLGFYR